MAVIEGRCPATGDVLVVEVTSADIVSVTRRTTRDRTIPWLVPGMVDLQVNGYGGHDVNGPEASAEAISHITHTLAAAGVTTWVPTVITASEEAIVASLRAITSACASDAVVARAIPYAHVEGPFLSPEDGPRGAHDRDHIRPLDAAEVARWTRHARIGYVTVSPHTANAPAEIARIVAGGTSVSLGHTHATPQQLRAATDAGASMSTHLGNGIFASLPRHPNQIWTQLADDRLVAGLIGDGHHLPPEVLTVMVRAKGSGRAFLVSDSAALAGCAPGVYHQPVGGDVELDEGGRLTLAGTPFLAGSAVNLAEVVRYVLGHTPFGLPEVMELASGTPARLIGDARRGRIQPGAQADLVLLDDSGAVVDVLRQGSRP